MFNRSPCRPCREEGAERGKEESCVGSLFVCRDIWCRDVRILFVARPIGHVSTYMRVRVPRDAHIDGWSQPV